MPETACRRWSRDQRAGPLRPRCSEPTGLKYLMILEGINDMNGAARGGAGGGSADDRRRSDRGHETDESAGAHARNQGDGCTLTPTATPTDAVEAMRQALNASSALRRVRRHGGLRQSYQDPADPRQFRAGYNKPTSCIPTIPVIRPWRTQSIFSIFVPSPRRQRRSDSAPGV